MERQYIFASHGTLAAGLLHSVELILGKQPNLHVLCAYSSETDKPEDFSQQVDTLLKTFSPQQELIVITDIFAGSVNNEFIRYLQRPHFHLIAGLNLPLVIEMLISPPDWDSKKLINEALANARENIQYCNYTVNNNLITDKDF